MPGPRPVPVIERLLRRTVRMEDGCWLWQGALKGNGYGKISTGPPVRNAYTHRVSYEHFHGPIPEGLEVAHSCDIRHCVNPHHLVLMTHEENVADCVAKGRQVKGASRSSAKLNDDKVRDIRRRASSGESNGSLAREYGVCSQLVDGIVLRKRWKHVD